MDLNFTPEEEAFRAEVKEFLRTKLPPSYAERISRGLGLSKEEHENWHARLNEQGWLASHWPVEYGGTGWTAVQQSIFNEECEAACAPRILPFGVSMLGPVLLKFGSEAQRAYWLPRMLDGSDWWCQGYSEPGAGSDLASLKTTAVRDGDNYVVNGQKTWTTLGQHANMIFCLVRTSTEGKPQQGISFLLIDMASEGIELRPIRTLDGGHEVNEIFFTDVRVPVENLVGEENKGWTYAKYLLTYERTGIANVGNAKRKLASLKKAAQSRKAAGRPLADDPLFAARVARVEIALRNMETTNLRVVASVAAGGAPGAESSMLKILGTEISQELDSLTRRIFGRYAQSNQPEATEPGFNGEVLGPPEALNKSAVYFNNRKLSIFGGSNEIQKNIITKMILGL